MGRKARGELVLSPSERYELEALTLRRKTAQALALRARIVLACADGAENKAVAARQRVTQQTVGKWRARYIEHRLDGLLDAPRSGAPRTIDDARVDAVIAKTLEGTPTAATHWSTRTMAREMGLTQTAVSRIWRAFGLQPHRQETFKLSSDPMFVDKVRDIVGLYLNPPLKALVLCVDEKSQIQALDRTQPGLPMKPWRCGTMTHDYKRNGTTTLFAALNVMEGQLIGTCMPQHRHQEWIKFLKLIDAQTPGDRELHLIVDNYATHKHPNVQKWLKRHPRFHMHFIPTSSSWLNMVERWFREITDKRIRRGTFHSVPQLIAAIEAYIAEHNANPRAFTWTAKVETIRAKVRRAREVLDKTASG